MSTEQQYFQQAKPGRLDYRACITCLQHPNYPGVYPITLHRGNDCLICHGKVEKEVQSRLK